MLEHIRVVASSMLVGDILPGSIDSEPPTAPSDVGITGNAVVEREPRGQRPTRHGSVDEAREEQARDQHGSARPARRGNRHEPERDNRRTRPTAPSSAGCASSGWRRAAAELEPRRITNAPRSMSSSEPVSRSASAPASSSASTVARAALNRANGVASGRADVVATSIAAVGRLLVFGNEGTAGQSNRQHRRQEQACIGRVSITTLLGCGS